MTQTYYEVIDTPISIEGVTNKVIRRECGAVTTFIGTVREFTKGRRTLYLEYAAYKTMAEKMLTKIGGEVKKNGLEHMLRLHIASVHFKFLISPLLLLYQLRTGKLRMKRMNTSWNALNKLFRFGKRVLGRWRLMDW